MYSSFKAVWTRKLIAEADKDNTGKLKSEVVYSLLANKDAVAGKTIAKETDEQIYEMTILVPALSRWVKLDLPKPVDSQDIKALTKAYDF